MLTHEPRVSLAVLEAMLAPYVSGGQLTLAAHATSRLPRTWPAIECAPYACAESGDGRCRDDRAAYFLDATELGDLLPLTKTEYVTGFESRRQTGEPHAPAEAQPDNLQAFTVCFAMDYDTGEDHTIDKPDEYAFWRDYVPEMKPAWPGKLLSWSMTDPISLKERKVTFDPTGGRERAGALNLWIYRRIVRARNHQPGFEGGDVTLVNWPQNDYWLGNLYGGTPRRGGAPPQACQAAQPLAALLDADRSAAPRRRPRGWRGLRLRPD